VLYSCVCVRVITTCVCVYLCVDVYLSGHSHLSESQEPRGALFVCVFAYDYDICVRVFVCLCVFVWAFTHAECSLFVECMCV